MGGDTAKQSALVRKRRPLVLGVLPLQEHMLAICPQIGTDGGTVRRVIARACCHWRRRAGCACFGVVFSRLCQVCLNRALVAAAKLKAAGLILPS